MTRPEHFCALIGDVGGHHDELYAALVTLGMDPDTYRLPEFLTVVQVGDLIHRGPDSMGVLRLVQRILDQQPDQWVQLTGNHEGQYLDLPPAFEWPEVLPEEGQQMLRSWVVSRQLRFAAALDTAHGPLLVTHAGLTAGMWRLIGEPATATEAADAVNALPWEHPEWAWRAGRMLGDCGRDFAAGPVWAEAGAELYASWLAHEAQGLPVPFGMVHGHSSAFSWNKKMWQCQPGPITERFVPDLTARHVKGEIGGQPFAGIDPSFGKVFSARSTWSPLVVPGVVVAR